MMEQTKKPLTEQTNPSDPDPILNFDERCITLTLEDWAFIANSLLQYNIVLRSFVKNVYGEFDCDSDFFSVSADRCIRLATLIESFYSMK